MHLCAIAMPFMVVATLFCGGCVQNCLDVSNPIEVASSDYDHMYEATREVLQEYGFVLDREDYRFGRLTTEPLAVPTAVEFWHRSANSTLRDAVESTINDQRRIVTVLIDPVKSKSQSFDDVPEPATPTARGSYLLDVNVAIERHEYPLYRLSGSTSPRRLINKLRDVPVEWQERGIKASYWQPIVRDHYFERCLIEAIVQRSEQRSHGNR